MVLLSVGCGAGDKDADDSLTMDELLELYEQFYGDDPGARTEEVVEFVGAQETLTDPPITETVVVVPMDVGVNGNDWVEARPGEPLTLTVRFASQYGDVVGMAVDTGVSQAITVVGSQTSLGLNDGRLTAEVEVDDDACDELPYRCTAEVWQVFAVTSAGAVSRPALVDVVFICGDCEDADCVMFLECPV